MLNRRRRGWRGISVWYWVVVVVSVRAPPQSGQAAGKGASGTSSIRAGGGGGRWAWAPCCAPALRPGRLGSPEGSWPNHEEGDWIILPPKEKFVSAGAYYETAFHELAHHSEVRLGWDHRKQGYDYGELVAEIAASLLSAELGVPQGEAIENHAAYLKHWLEGMKGDSSFILQASSQAGKVTDYLLSFVRDDKEATEDEEATATAAA